MSKSYKLQWSDDFDGAADSPPDPTCWRYETGGPGGGNGELQTYTDQRDNSYQDGRGNLCIVARRDAADGFTSARLVTKGLVEFQYGRFETRAKLAKGVGLWSAVWLLGSNIDGEPWPDCGEIDVMEHVGARAERVFGTVHCPGHFFRDGISGEHIAAIDLTEDYHVFAVDWSESEIVWSIDGQPYFTVTADRLGASWVFDHPFYILINLAVGGWLGGDVPDSTQFPAVLQIDYVKILSAI